MTNTTDIDRALATITRTGEAWVSGVVAMTLAQMGEARRTGKRNAQGLELVAGIAR